jgi:hypothetical protein
MVIQQQQTSIASMRYANVCINTLLYNLANNILFRAYRQSIRKLNNHPGRKHLPKIVSLMQTGNGKNAYIVKLSCAHNIETYTNGMSLETKLEKLSLFLNQAIHGT